MNMLKLKDKKNTPYIIAEVAQAHDGSLGSAHSFIDAIAESGANAVKFQTHFSEEESTFDEPWRVKFSSQDYNRFDYWKRIEFTENQWIELKKHADEKKIDFLSSPFSLKAFNILKKLKINYWKIASGEIYNQELMNECIKDKRPLLISTGLMKDKEITKLYKNLIKKNKKFCFFHCVTMYPTPSDRWNLNRILEMKKKYKCPIGFSDHSGEIYSGLAAATLGVEFLEVHVTFNKKSFGPDTRASLEFEDLKKLVEGCKKITNSMSIQKKAQNISKNKIIFSRSWALKNDMKKGQTINSHDLILKKPGNGINFENKKDIVGKKLNKNKSKNYLLKYKDFN